MNRTPPPILCPLCASRDRSRHFHRDRRRDYYRCPTCRLVHVPPEQRPGRAFERAEYDKHQNSPADAGYRRFLSRLFVPLNARLAPASQGLDFGSGPGPTLSVMFEEAGHHVMLYDPHYAPDGRALTRRYDFITASEVAEHLHHPGRELTRLWALLRPGGWLGIMTKLVTTQAAFTRWHYKSDLTHVSFFSLATMAWLAARWESQAIAIDADVVLLRKPGLAE